MAVSTRCSVVFCVFRQRMALALGMVCLVVAMPVAGALAADATGIWITTDGEAHVRVSVCGEFLCGQIVSLKDPIDKDTGKPTKDKSNPDPTKRDNPIIGVQLFQQMKPEGPGHWRGLIYNPDDGKSYDATVTLEDNKLRVRGCGLGGLVCQSEIWSR